MFMVRGLFGKVKIMETTAIKFRVNAEELAAIRRMADKQAVAAYVRNKALARAAADDLGYERGIVNQLAEVAQSFHAIAKSVRETDIEPPQSVWQPIMDNIADASAKIPNL